MVNLYTLYKTQDPEKHTLFSGTDPYRPNKGILAGGTAIDCCGHFMDETVFVIIIPGIINQGKLNKN